MKKVSYFLIAFLLVIFCCQAWADTGVTTSNGFLYKPSLGAKGTTEKNTFDAGLDKVDARLGKEIWVGDPKYGATLQSALTTIGNTATILRVPAGTHSIAADLTVPGNVTLKPERGANFAVATGKTLTLNCAIDAGPYQIFSCTGTGKVVIGETNAIDHVCPEWWGALGNAWYINGTSWYADAAHTIPAHDDSAALQAAIDCVCNNLYRRAPRIDLNGHYLLGSQVTIAARGSRPYFHGSGGGSQYGYDDSGYDSDGTTEAGSLGSAIINGTATYAIKITDYAKPFFDNIFFHGGITDAPGTGSVVIADCAGGQGFRNCSFIKGYSGVCFQASAIYADSAPYGIYFDRCRFQNYMAYSTYNSDWITSPDQNRGAAFRFEQPANIDFNSCDFSGWPSHFYGDYPAHPYGYFGMLRFNNCWLQGSRMQSFYTAGKGHLQFKDSYFELCAVCLPYAGRSYYSTGGTDTRLAVIDLGSDKSTGSYPSVIDFDGVDVANNYFAGDNAGDQGRTMIVAFYADLLVKGGRISTGKRPFARIQQVGQVNLSGPIINTSLSGSYPVSSGDALNFYGAGTYDRYSPDAGMLTPGFYGLGNFIGVYFIQKPNWLPRAYMNPEIDSTIIKGPLTAPRGFQLGELSTVWAYNNWDNVTDLGTQSRQGDIIWNTLARTGQRLGLICIASGSDWGGAGNGTWIPFGNTGFRTGASSPIGSVTPYFIGEEYYTGGHWYKAHGLANTDWTALN